MKKKVLTLFSLTLIFCLLFVAFGCKQKDMKAGGTLVWARPGDAKSLDPGDIDDGNSGRACEQIYEGLLFYKPGTDIIIPGLAEKWEIADDNLSVTFYLKKGVKFHDGTDFNADAVVFSFGRQHYEDHPYHDMGNWNYWYSNDLDTIVKDIVKVDDYTVQVTLNEVTATLLLNFTGYFGYIVSPTAVEKYGKDEYRKNPVGTGPFKFVEWVKDDRIVFERFDGYWDKPALLDRIIMKIIPEPTARYLALKKGEVDLIDDPALENIPEILADPNLKAVKVPPSNIAYAAIQVEHPPLDNVKVRQAINYAINVDDILSVAFGDSGVKNSLPLPPTCPGRNESIKPYEYNPAKAKQLLAEAGFPDGFETTLWAMNTSRPYMPQPMKVVEIMQDQLSKVGIKAEIITYDTGTYWDKIDAGEFDIAVMGWTDPGDPDIFLGTLLTDNVLNSARWVNEKFISLVEQGRASMNMDDRVKYYYEAQQIWHDEAPWVMLGSNAVYQPMKKSVNDFVVYPQGQKRAKWAWIEK
jgi:peptide/nickel transport system substrate-binding protein